MLDHGRLPMTMVDRELQWSTVNDHGRMTIVVHGRPWSVSSGQYSQINYKFTFTREITFKNGAVFAESCANACGCCIISCRCGSRGTFKFIRRVLKKWMRFVLIFWFFEDAASYIRYAVGLTDANQTMRKYVLPSNPIKSYVKYNYQSHPTNS